MIIENAKDNTTTNKADAARLPQKKLKGESFLEEYFGKLIEDINGWEYENVSTGTQVGNEEW